MKQTDDELWLDHLLKQPPTLSDRGFTNSMIDRITRKEKLRKRVFIAAGSAWLLLLLLFSPRYALISMSQRVVDASSQTYGFLRLLVDMDLPAMVVQSNNVPTIIVILLGVYALVSLQIKGQ